MSPYAALAALRLGSPLPDLQPWLAQRIGTIDEAWLSVAGVDVRIDSGGNIATLYFPSRFPTNISLDCLHIGMTFDALAKDYRRFRRSARHGPKLTAYSTDSGENETITVHITNEGIVHSIKFEKTNAILSGPDYPGGKIHSVSLRSYTRDAEILADWAGQARADYYSDNHAEAHWLLNDANPHDWHRYALEYNWGQGVEPLFWIVRQPGCEKATALLCFYMARPGQYLDHVLDPDGIPGYLKDAYDLIVEIRDRYLRGVYSSATIAFDTDFALTHEAYLPADPDQAALDFMIPPPMRRNVPGCAFVTNQAPEHPIRPDLFPPPFSKLRPPPPGDT